MRCILCITKPLVLYLHACFGVTFETPSMVQCIAGRLLGWGRLSSLLPPPPMPPSLPSPHSTFLTVEGFQGILVHSNVNPAPKSAAEFGRFRRFVLPICWVSEFRRFVLLICVGFL